MNSMDPHTRSQVPVTLWLVDLAQTFPEEHLALYKSWLNPVELARWKRFHFERDRQRFLVCRALMREVIGGELKVDPGGVEFVLNDWGKPQVFTPGTREPSVHFNLSHTHGLGVLAVCREAVTGVDVEDVQRRIEPHKVADRFFSALECEQLETLTGQHERDVFFAFWTLKEAYIKAVGKGLAIALDSFSFLLEGNNITVRFSEQHPDEPEQWQFFRYRYGTRHPVALAVNTALPVRLHWMAGAPGSGFEPIDLSGLAMSRSRA